MHHLQIRHVTILILLKLWMRLGLYNDLFSGPVSSPLFIYDSISECIKSCLTDCY